ncbi:MAG: SDR family oxidoreductase [Chloroflexi bacterium]|nr:SDR family oxidoreductase [Chloroflexota bacterium]
MELGLKGKVAAITGGSEGIGLVTAIRLAQEGASVAICARRPDVLQAAADEIGKHGNVLAVVADAMKREEIERFVAETVARFGRLDILVNNAGTSNAGAFESVTDEVWQQDLDLKLFGAIRASRAAIPHMKKQGGGRIINITMTGGKQPGAKSVPTTVSRAAGIALTKALSKDLAADKILVNTVCVGLIKSGQMARGATRRGVPVDEHYAQLGKNVPLGRIGETGEAANVIVFLASDAASYVTGASVNVDGGMSGVV